MVLRRGTTNRSSGPKRGLGPPWGRPERLAPQSRRQRRRRDKGQPTSLGTPPAAARPPQPDGPPHPRPLEPLQAGTRPTSRPASPGGFRSASGPTPPPRPDSSPEGEPRSGRSCSPQPRSPAPGPRTHSPAGWTHSPDAVAALPLSATLLAARPRDTRTAPARPGPG